MKVAQKQRVRTRIKTLGNIIHNGNSCTLDLVFEAIIFIVSKQHIDARNKFTRMAPYMKILKCPLRR